MKVPFNKVKEIADTLPIGYYLGAKVTLEIKEHGTEAYADLHTRKIVIGYELLNRAFKALSDTCDQQEIENSIRCLLYHEVSHLLLTPRALQPRRYTPSHKAVDYDFDILNIFEDERIETVLKDYYMNVNFKRFVFAVNGQPVLKPTDPKEAFFKVVRYRSGKKEWVDIVQEIINKYSALTSIDNTSCVNDYSNDIYLLYKKIADQFKRQAEKQKSQPQPQQTGSETKPSSNQKQVSNPPSDNMIPEELRPILEEAEKQQTSGTAGISMPNVREVGKQLFNKANEFTAPVEKIIKKSINKKNMQSGAFNKYSGMLNPRSTGREDFRWWQAPEAKGMNSAFSKIKLNLFVDESGSFARSQGHINQLIQTLSDLEDKYPQFTFDVIPLGAEERILPKKDRYIKCDTGSYVSDKLEPIFRKVQTPGVCKNIVVMDGQFYQPNAGSRYACDCSYFKAFNSNNVTIISDTDNMDCLNKYAPSANKTFVKRDYAKVFATNVIASLERLLA